MACTIASILLLLTSCDGDDEAFSNTGGTGGESPDTTGQEIDSQNTVGQDGTHSSDTEQDVAGKDTAIQDIGGQDAAGDFDGSRPFCGNGIVEPEEDCDGKSLDNETCQTVGMGEGQLACTNDCRFDTSGCIDIIDAGNYGDVATEQLDAAPPREDLGVGDGHDVICIGDSWMSLGISGIQQSLVRLSGQPYRTYGIAGTLLLNGQIPAQYDMAKIANPDIKTVVMTSGGNDFIMNPLVSADCLSGGQLCEQTGEEIKTTLRELYSRMNDDGVMDVIYIMYSGDVGLHVETDDLVSEGDACPSLSPIKCHMLPTTEIMAGETLDGIHPAPAACDRIAQEIINMMEERGMRR